MAFEKHETASTSSTTTTTTRSDNFLQLNFSNLEIIGRSKEQQILEEAFGRITQQGTAKTTEIVLVHGESGAGKSKLVQHLEHKVYKSRRSKSSILHNNNYGGYFVSGKYDQLQNATRPYSAIVGAITDLCNQVADNSKLLQQVQKEMFDVMGHETSVLTNLIPSLSELLTCPQEEEQSDDDKSCDTHHDSDDGNDEKPSSPSQHQRKRQQQQQQQNVVIDETPKTTNLRQFLTKQSSCTSHNSHRINSLSPSGHGYSFQIFVLLFRTFLRTFCKPARPLILFLDDLQWSDEASRKLISMLTSDPTLQNLLLVAAYRDNDEAKYEFDSRLCKYQITDISVGPLTLESIGCIISTVTGVAQENTTTLAKVVLQKTGGNAFFAIQYLEALYRQQLLYYNIVMTRWDWDVQKIKVNTTVSDNIVDLLIGKIQSLPKQLQSLLMFAACLGFTFDIEILQTILKSENIMIAQGADVTLLSLHDKLMELSSHGLLQLFNEKKYQFTHDRVQQSAHALLPQLINDCDALYLRIGNLLLECYNGPDSESWMLFRGVDLLNEQSLYITDKEKKMGLVELNLQAAQEAIPQMAFISAAQYVQQGIDLMDPNTMWKDHYDLTLDLFAMHAKMQHACGNAEESLKIVDIIVENAISTQDKLVAFYQQVVILGERLEVSEAIVQHQKVFKILKVRMPAKANKLHLMYEVMKTKRLLNGRTAKDLLELPTMTDPTKLITMQFLLRYSICCYEKEEIPSCFVACMRIARATIKYGVSPDGIFGLMAFGVVLGALGDFNAAHEYGKLGYELLKRDGMESGHAAAVHCSTVFLDHLKRPLQGTLTLLLEAYRKGLQHGEVGHSVPCIVAHAHIATNIGTKLDNLEKQVKSFCDVLVEFNQEATLTIILLYHQFILNLSGKTSNPLILSGRSMDEKKVFHSLVESNGLIAKQLYFFRMMVRYLFGAYDMANRDRLVVDQLVKKDTWITNYFIATYSGLVCFAIARQYQIRKLKKANNKDDCCTLENQRNHDKMMKQYTKLAMKYITIIANYTKRGSVNGPPMLQLLQAEATCMKSNKNHKQIQDAYDLAIQFTRRSGFRIFTGIGLERAGDYFYSVAHDVTTAEEYIQNAYLEYKEFGAFGKTKLIQEKYPWLSFLCIDDTIEGINNSSSVSKKMKGDVVSTLKDHDRIHKKGLQTHNNDNNNNSNKEQKIIISNW